MNRICDKCNNFEISPDGTREKCHALREGSRMIAWMTKEYAEQRMEGEKKHCKGFKKIQPLVFK